MSEKAELRIDIEAARRSSTGSRCSPMRLPRERSGSLPSRASRGV